MRRTIASLVFLTSSAVIASGALLPADKVDTSIGTPENMYVKSVKLDGRLLVTPFLKQADLLNGRLLEFEMTITRIERRKIG